MLAYLVALPLLVILSFKQKYKDSVLARFFLFNNKRFTKKDGVWLHACSFGEVMALKPLIDRLTNEDIKITTMTHTGYDVANRYHLQTRYLPFEIFLPFWITRQKILVVIEAEFWYMLFASFYAKGGKIILLNARISKKSVKKYIKMRWFYSRIFFFIDKIYCQSEIDAYRFQTLGAKNIEVIGNIKLAQEITVTIQYPKQQVPVIVAASTHDTEEESILQNYEKYLKTNKAKLIVVPRHPERFNVVYEILKRFATKNHLHVKRLSKDASFNADIILVDIMGELNNIYNISNIAILGGSFLKGIGGHNPLEPAHFGCKIITGKYFANQQELFKNVEHVQYVEAYEIYEALIKSKELPNSNITQEINIDSVIKYIQGKIDGKR